MSEIRFEWRPLRRSVMCSEWPWLAGQRPLTPTGSVLFQLRLGLCDHFQRVVHLDAKIANRSLQLSVPKEELNGPEVLGLPIYQGRLGPPVRVRPVARLVQSQPLDPGIDDSGVLPGGKVGLAVQSAPE